MTNQTQSELEELQCKLDKVENRSRRSNLRFIGIPEEAFPLSNPILLKKWQLAVRRASVTGALWTPTRHHCLCSLHFQEHCFEIAGLIRRLREGAVPSIFHFPRSAKPKDRLGRRKRKATIGVILASRDSIRQEHNYSVPDIETLKRRLQFSEEDRAQKERQLRNARERESRLRQMCLTIKKELREKNSLTKQLQKKLELYEGSD
ncbi:THAP domain-containing protein 1 B-like isoform X2 [Pleurodeles waltl]|uniref:THAP domain-containing protein 1 B-like isoform X2 n=1 Tax=Pleurodeles waltl TaxID=8319 RepID=UPI0037095A9D